MLHGLVKLSSSQHLSRGLPRADGTRSTLAKADARRALGLTVTGLAGRDRTLIRRPDRMPWCAMGACEFLRHTQGNACRKIRPATSPCADLV